MEEIRLFFDQSNKLWKRSQFSALFNGTIHNSKKKKSRKCRICDIEKNIRNEKPNS
jgi:hypothetical protein